MPLDDGPTDEDLDEVEDPEPLGDEDEDDGDEPDADEDDLGVGE